MKTISNEYIYLDGMWLRREQLIQLALNAGRFDVAEHYLCALLADAVVSGRREAIVEVNEVREHYGVKAIPLADGELEDDSRRFQNMQTAADEEAQRLFLKMDGQHRIDVLRRSMSRLLSDYHLFTYARHWLAIFMVVRDRLVGVSLNQLSFIDLALEISPDDLPERLKMHKNTTKNFGREINEADRGEVYYRMKSNPLKELCDTFWNIIKKTILTEF